MWTGGWTGEWTSGLVRRHLNGEWASVDEWMFQYQVSDQIAG